MSPESKETVGLQEGHLPSEEEYRALVEQERIPSVYTFHNLAGPNLYMLVVPPEGTKLGDTFKTLPLQTFIFLDKNGSEIGEAVKHWLTKDEANLYKEMRKKNNDIIEKLKFKEEAKIIKKETSKKGSLIQWVINIRKTLSD